MWMTRISINQPVFATMVMLALMVLGIISYHRLGVELVHDGLRRRVLEHPSGDRVHVHARAHG
jgi:hypothetical protein